MTNTAYDLSIYEPKRRRQEQEQAVQVRVVSKRSAQDIRRPKAILQGAVVMAMLASIMSLVLYSNAILTELNDQISTEVSKNQVLISENNRLQAEIESKMSLRSIEDIAKNQLGMSEVEPYQVTYVNRCEGDKIVYSEKAASETSVLSSVSNTISSVLEYLRISFNKN